MKITINWWKDGKHETDTRCDICNELNTVAVFTKDCCEFNICRSCLLNSVSAIGYAINLRAESAKIEAKQKGA